MKLCIITQRVLIDSLGCINKGRKSGTRDVFALLYFVLVRKLVHCIRIEISSFISHWSPVPRETGVVNGIISYLGEKDWHISVFCMPTALWILSFSPESDQDSTMALSSFYRRETRFRQVTMSLESHSSWITVYQTKNLKLLLLKYLLDIKN